MKNLKRQNKMENPAKPRESLWSGCDGTDSAVQLINKINAIHKKYSVPQSSFNGVQKVESEVCTTQKALKFSKKEPKVPKMHISPFRHPALGEKTDFFRMVHEKTSVDNLKQRGNFRRHKKSGAKKATAQANIPHFEYRVGARNNSKTGYNFYPQKEINTISSIEIGDSQRPKHIYSAKKMPAGSQQRVPASKGKIVKSRLLKGAKKRGPRNSANGDLPFVQKQPSKNPKGRSYQEPSYSMFHNTTVNKAKQVGRKRTILKADDTVMYKNHQHKLGASGNRSTKIPIFLQKKKLKQEVKEEEIKQKYFKMYDQAGVTLQSSDSHRDLIRFKKSQKMEVTPREQKVIDEGEDDPILGLRGTLDDHVNPVNVIADTGDMVLVKQNHKQFKGSQSDFDKFEQDNHKKLAISSAKIQQIYQRLKDITTSLGLTDEDIGLEVNDVSPLSYNRDAKLEALSKIEEIQTKFRKTYIKLTDQVERIHHYSKQVLASARNGKSLQAQQLKALLKRVQCVNSSYNRLKQIDNLRIKYEKLEKNKADFRTEEELVLQVLDRDKKLQQLQKHQKTELIDEFSVRPQPSSDLEHQAWRAHIPKRKKLKKQYRGMAEDSV
ncbi:unnamed protein product [Moneuplotes crassus]|uniref:Uncharacterized protein n=1 Tax=Euplotes crassus TaxID=5936 RepID=A0AAD1Y387_EUPCR|nr:unnamed protein product [Moneuplotes crassus]